MRLDGDIYLVTKTRKYVLLRLDEMLAGKPGVSYDHALITVEHVLPQNPKQGSQWLRHFTGRHGVCMFALTSQVLQHQKWAPELLRKRQLRLVGLLADEWDL